MPEHPAPIRRLVEAFLVLPGIGRRTAERFAFALTQREPDAVRTLAEALLNLTAGLTVCRDCGQPSENDRCAICADPTRSRQELCVVADSRTILLMEQTGLYRGRYFVLGGYYDPLTGGQLDGLRVRPLQERLRGGEVREVILALNANTVGDATVLYLKEALKPHAVRVTRLARGLPTGSEILYADEQTLASALTGRREV